MSDNTKSPASMHMEAMFNESDRDIPRDVPELTRQFTHVMSFANACKLFSDLEVAALQSPIFNHDRDEVDICNVMSLSEEIKRLFYYLEYFNNQKRR